MQALTKNTIEIFSEDFANCLFMGPVAGERYFEEIDMEGVMYSGKGSIRGQHSWRYEKKRVGIPRIPGITRAYPNVGEASNYGYHALVAEVPLRTRMEVYTENMVAVPKEWSLLLTVSRGVDPVRMAIKFGERYVEEDLNIGIGRNMSSHEIKMCFKRSREDRLSLIFQGEGMRRESSYVAVHDLRIVRRFESSESPERMSDELLRRRAKYDAHADGTVSANLPKP